MHLLGEQEFLFVELKKDLQILEVLLVLFLPIFCRISIYHELQFFSLLIVEYVLTCLLLPIFNLFFLNTLYHIFLTLLFINLLLLLHLNLDQLLND